MARPGKTKGYSQAMTNAEKIDVEHSKGSYAFDECESNLASTIARHDQFAGDKDKGRTKSIDVVAS